MGKTAFSLVAAFGAEVDGPAVASARAARVFRRLEAFGIAVCLVQESRKNFQKLEKRHVRRCEDFANTAMRESYSSIGNDYKRFVRSFHYESAVLCPAKCLYIHTSDRGFLSSGEITQSGRVPYCLWHQR